MLPKPKHLGPQYGEQFKDKSVVEAYRYRPDYPDATFDILDDLNVINPGFKGVIPVAVLSSDLVCHVETESLSLDWDIGEVCLT